MRVHTTQTDSVVSAEDPESDASTESLKAQPDEAKCEFPRQAVLLATARIILKNGMGGRLEVNALVDQGSMRSFVSKRVVSLLNVPTVPAAINIKGVGNSFAAATKEFCRLTLVSTSSPAFSLDFDALVLDQLTSNLPPREISMSNWTHTKGLKLADPNFMKPKRIDCILGADVFACIVLDGIICGSSETPVAQNTRLGGILTGRTGPEILHAESSCVSTFFVQGDLGISKPITRTWEIEKIPQKPC